MSILRFVILFGALLWTSQVSAQPLTQAQLDAHLRQLIVAGVQADLADKGQVSDDLVRWTIQYGKQGVTEREAAVAILIKLYRAETGIDPTTNAITRHAFKHWIDETGELYGEGFEPTP